MYRISLHITRTKNTQNSKERSGSKLYVNFGVQVGFTALLHSNARKAISHQYVRIKKKFVFLLFSMERLVICSGIVYERKCSTYSFQIICIRPPFLCLVCFRGVASHVSMVVFIPVRIVTQHVIPFHLLFRVTVLTSGRSSSCNGLIHRYA